MRLPAALFLALATASPATAQATAPIRIGLSAPLSGPDAAFGQGLRLGAEQAIADINRVSGPGLRKLALVVADDAGDARQALAVARNFTADGIGLVVGPFGTAAASGALPGYGTSAVVVLPGATWTPLTAKGARMVFRVGPNDGQQAALAAAWLAAGPGAGKRIGLIHDRSSFGRGLADAVAAALKGRGLQPVAFEGMTRGSREGAAGIVAKLKQSRVDAVYFGGLGPEAAALVKGMREAGLAAPMVASDGILDKDFPSAAGWHAEGTLMTLPGEARRLPDPKDAKAKIAPRTAEADTVAVAGYAAVEVLAQAVERCRSQEPGRVAASLHNDGPVRTLLGDLSFDEKGDLRRPDLTLVAWRRTPDGRLDYLGNVISP